MNKQHSPFSLPRKDLFSALQRNLFIIFLLLFFGAFALYKLMDMSLEERVSHKDELVALENRIHQTEISWSQWLTLSGQNADMATTKVSAAEWHSRLMNDYSEIEKMLQHLHRKMPNIPIMSVQDALVFLNSLKRTVQDNKPLDRQQQRRIYQMIKESNQLDIKLIELEVSYSYQNSVYGYKLVWSPFIILGFIAIILILVGWSLARRLSKGFIHLHYVLEKHKQGGLTVEQGYHKVDEFTDLGRLLDNELSSREFDYQQAQKRLHVIQNVVERLHTPFLIANASGDVEWVSDGLTLLWKSNKTTFETYFSVDEGLVGPLGEQLPDSVLNAQEEHRLMLNEGVYRVQVKRIDDHTDVDKPTFSYLMTLDLASDLAELEVLRKSLELMRQGVWDMPIRLLRESSPFASFSKELESVRESVLQLLNVANSSQESLGYSVKITKLQQIETLLEAKIHDNHFDENEIEKQEEEGKASVPSQAIQEIADELDSMSFLSEQIQDTVLIGFELLLQRLTMVEKDIANNVMLLSEVDRCLNEVRAGVLTSLSAADGEGEQVRRRFSLDLNHDIDGVQKHIESIKDMTDSTLSLLQSDRSVGVARLERAKQTVTELRERINVLLEKESLLGSSVIQKIECDSDSDDGSNDQINEF